MTNTKKLLILRSVTLLLLLARESVSIFFNQTSYINIKPLDLTKQFTLLFRTCEGGPLLHQTGNSNDYFELVVGPGTVNYTIGTFTSSSLALHWKSTSSQLEAVHVGSQLDQNKPYQVTFSPRTSSGNATLSISLGSSVHTVQVPETIYNVSAKNLTLGHGFVGCVIFGDVFDLKNVYANVSTSVVCPLDGGERCRRAACPSGYKGYYCEINIDDCASSPCHHAATCIDKVANYSCQCGPAWDGRNCDILKDKTFCDYKPCANGGICQHTSNFNNYTCACPVPYTGRNCTEIADPCKNMPCRNNATCTNIRNITFQCNCPKGFTGRRCETDIDDCARADCGSGQCVDVVDSYSCNCTGSGYKDPNCTDDINECDSKPCRNNAACSNYAGGYLCTCVGDFKGKNCDVRINNCLPQPCQNGGNCTDLAKDFECVCPVGFSGKSCEVELHPCNVKGCTACEDTPCNHGNCSCNCTDDTMYYNCTCEEGYRGVNCDQDINECVDGFIQTNICGDNGTCRNTNGSFKCLCQEGFTGKYCNETEGPCNPNPCVNGKCHRINVTMNISSHGSNSSEFIETYNCSCRGGWKGQNCSEDIDECRDNSDKCNRSTSNCVNTQGGFNCACLPGYGGQDCTDIDECKTIKPCERGSCINREGNYECHCPLGYTGKNCSSNLDDCLLEEGNTKCKNGKCIDAVASFTCKCDVGWSGPFCNVDVDECKLGYCVNGTCNNTQGSYTCTCDAGFTNMNCSMDIDECQYSPCLNGGTCMDKVNDYECDCTPCYRGKSCNVTRGLCDYGICKDGPVNYTCQCFDGFSGQNCSTDKDECTDMPCKNNATCIQKSNATAVKMYFGDDRVYPKNESGGYLCVCQPGFNGSNCENNIDECQLYQACNVTGRHSCVDGVNNYTCICKDGFTGRNCSEDIDECASTPCQNNGTCQNRIARYSCTCGSNHTGKNCEHLIDPCTALEPCKNGAKCKVIPDYNYTCLCAEGFAGTTCTDRTTLGFDGTSSMTVNVPQTIANVSFSFQTIFSEGALVSVIGKWVLALVLGKLELICAGSPKCEVGTPGMFSDSNWHTVQITVNGLSVTVKAGSGQGFQSCAKDCVSSRSRRDAASESRLIVGTNSEDSKLPQFVGSIRDLSVNDDKYYPGVTGVITQGLVPDFQRQNVCSSDPCVNGFCKDLWTRYSCECDRYWTSPNCTESVQWGTFGAINQLKNGYRPKSNNRSYASFSVDKTFKNLAFTIRTRSTSSLIVQLKSSSSMVLSVEIDNNGYLRIRDRNSSANLEPSEALKINDAIPHYIYINHSAIQVDNKTYEVTVMSLPVRIVFVGGLPENVDEAMSAQYRGCIRDVRLNGEQLLFFNQTSSRLNSTQQNIAMGCSGEDVCANISGSTPCSNRGNCTDLWNDFRCECQSPYGGDICELYGCEWAKLCPGNGTCLNLKDTSEYECINQVTFNSSQSSAFFRNSTSFSDVNSLVVQCRTRQNDTIILSSVHNATYFELAVDNGFANVKYSFAENMTGIINTGRFISDGNWHEIKIESFASQTRFTISPMEQQQDKFTLLNNESFSHNVSLLNDSFANLLSMGGVHVGSSPINSTREDLLGCLREIRLGKHLLTFTGSNTTVELIPALRIANSAFSSADLNNVRIGCHSNVVCTSNLCGNGTCLQGWNDIHCTCPGGHSGDRCQFNACNSSPCVTGTCTVSDTGFKCTCADKYVGVYCNETCTLGFCKNGGDCSISGGKITCTCESDWTGAFCESAVPRDDDSDDKDNLPLIIGLSVGGFVLLLLVVAVIFVCTRQTSQTFGIYSPSGEEKAGARVEMNPVLNVPPPEKLI